MLWLILPLTYDGDPVGQLGPLVLYRPGVELAARISLKSFSILATFTALLATMTISTLGHALDRLDAGPVLAAIDAENIWKWGDRDGIVREQVAIRVFRQRNRCRFLDVAVQLTALVDDLSIAGRPRATYGGFNMRTFPEFDQRKIVMHVEPPESKPRRA